MYDGNSLQSYNKLYNHLLNNDVVFNSFKPNSSNYYTPPHTFHQTTFASVPSALHVNNQCVLPTNSDLEKVPNFKNFLQPVPGSNLVAQASSHHVPLSAGSIYQSSEQQNSFSSMCYDFFKNEWLTAFQKFSMDQNDSKPSVSAAASVSIPATSHQANADSGSSGIYIAVQDINCLSDIQPCNDNNKIHVTVANGHIIESSYIGKLSVPSGHVLSAYIFPGINGSLLSVSSFVDLGYIVSYSTHKVEFSLN